MQDTLFVFLQLTQPHNKQMMGHLCEGSLFYGYEKIALKIKQVFFIIGFEVFVHLNFCKCFFRSGDNVYVLDAQNEKEMLFWLEKLQMKRKQFNVQQKKLLFKKTSCQQKVRNYCFSFRIHLFLNINLSCR